MIIRIRPKSQDHLPPALRKLIPPPAYELHVVVTDDAYEMGTVLEKWTRFRLTDSQVSVHMAVLGGSGSGKSKFIELFLRQRLLDGKAFGLWDPHGDLAKSLVAFVA